ncbi:MAG: PadR family transcriptional regulator [Thermaerobacter sp.]|nr:PadR family transcriptional regulator [Thermaerobacter sp.]
MFVDEGLPLTEGFFYILLVLYSAPSHGYAIMQHVERMSDNHVRIGAGTLYTALGTLLKKGLIQSTPAPEGADPRRKMYAITEAGQSVLRSEVERLKHMARTAEPILRTERRF